jgi:hypothetical protein
MIVTHLRDVKEIKHGQFRSELEGVCSTELKVDVEPGR